MVISKDKAKKIARQVTQPLYEKQGEAEQAIKIFITKLAEEEVPAPIAKVFKTHSEFIETRSYIYVSGVGIASNNHVSFTHQVPIISSEMQLSTVDAKKYCKLKDAESDAGAEAKKKEREIYNAILGLKTAKRIIENLPELKDLIEEATGTTTTAITVPVKEVRRDIVNLLKAAKAS